VWKQSVKLYLTSNNATDIEQTSYDGVFKSFRTESITKYTVNNNKQSLRSNTKGYGGKTH
jgi:hypothetical protein